jgi:molecular chaperone HtpG
MSISLSNAEKKADNARTLSAFRDFNLLGIREKVADILKLVGRTEEIFSTYTTHDISHIEKMLEMLDWLIPPDTQKNMTSADWLLTVLAIYLHDLGMLVTKQEYTDRHQNEDFNKFLNDLYTNSENNDYLGRTEKMEGEDKEHFFYQEYIRKHHAIRIKEWITGKTSTRWGKNIKVISDTIVEILKPLPPRFKENLADICASHHADNLDQQEYFPISQRYGTDSSEIANVQYAAILLRTTDLLHVTRDRTPSVMYKLLNISDPLGIDEWKKQEGIFSVSMKSREFDTSNPDSHIIIVIANFYEERPYFALAEYLVYASEQIEQSKRWADKTQSTKDGKGYFFPWSIVKGDIRVEGNEPVPMRFDLDRGRLLELLVGHTIYNDPTVAIRELLQNAIDAVRYQDFNQQKNKTGQIAREGLGEVKVYWDKNERELIVEDVGTGMNLDIIKFHLMRVGSSFYDTPNFHNENKDFSSISRFGIGVLTCFMISDDIEIITCQQGQGYRIRMTSVRAEYLLKNLDSGHPDLENIENHGTKVKLRLRANIDVSKNTILDILKYWIIIPECKVWYVEKGQEPQRVGFEKTIDALESYLAENETSNYDVIIKNHNQGNEKYELVFAVNKSTYSPERTFKSVETSQAKGHTNPVVCIEGIRTDNTLPGFRVNPFFALLSVRGNKRFRTTVSRMGLEKDDEYKKVASLCIKLLFNYIDDELKRIANFPSHPLSQASSAGIWLYQGLMKYISPFLEDEINILYRNLNVIVVEDIATKGDIEFQTNRKLISHEELNNYTKFWTIESRLVDYLGIMSRDLGTELSLNEFLNALAPSYRDKNISVIIPDARMFKTELFLSHIITSAEFSRSNLQTKLSWQKKSSNNLNGTLHERFVNEMYAKRVLEILEETRLVPDLNPRTGESITKSLESILLYTVCAPIQGDLEGIICVRTRFCTVIRSDCQLAKAIINLQDALSDPSILDDEFGIILTGLTLISMAINQDRTYFTLSYNTREIPFSLIWRSLIEKLNKVLKKLNSDTISENFEEFTGGYKNYFSASDYWRNWEKG